MSNRSAALSRGVCALDLNTGTYTTLVDPSNHRYGIGYVAPHPEVSDLVAVLPLIDSMNWKQCQTVRDDVTLGQCDYPALMMAERIGPSWMLTELATSPPSPRPLHAAWSPLNTATEDEATAAWLVVATGGGGAWRGEVTW